MATENVEIKKQLLDMLVQKQALKISKTTSDLFTFKSGRKSPNFANIGSLTDGESLSFLRKAFAKNVHDLVQSGEMEDFDFVFGPAYKGIPLATLLCDGLHEAYGWNKRMLYDRKEAKNYGDKASDQTIVGAGFFKPGSRILVIDDVITTGGAKLDALEKIRQLGECKVVGIAIAVDRQEKMGDAEKVEALSAIQSIEKNFGIKTFPLLKMQDIFALVSPTLSPEIRKAWVEYYDKYGAITLH
ncbi:MAG: orotate phosphoribosyltransferase [Candidatus Micrarchaeia archaeon]